MSASFDLLAGSEVWIADIGATIHNTPHKIGMINIREGKESNSITVGNGEKVISVAVGSITGTVTSKIGKKVAKVTLNHVVHTPHSKFNLLSIMKMMSDGWSLIGNKNY